MAVVCGAGAVVVNGRVGVGISSAALTAGTAGCIVQMCETGVIPVNELHITAADAKAARDLFRFNIVIPP
jgi:hypothetical protein